VLARQLRDPQRAFSGREPGVAAHRHGGRPSVGCLAGESETETLYALATLDCGDRHAFRLHHWTLLDMELQVGGQAFAAR
jgi:hypothetical protein